jgi:RNA polymerase sigma-70 factor (ECF subfamily)
MTGNPLSVPNMNSTSLSLLQRLGADPGADDWRRLVDDYAPMIRRWLGQQGVAAEDCDDITQDVMTVLVKRIGEFQRQRTGSFRRWVRTMTVNCMRDHFRKAKKLPRPTGGSDMVQLMNELADDQSQLSQRWDQEHSRHLLGILLQRVEPEFRRQTWEAFSLVAIEKLPTKTVADQLGMTSNAVMVAKSRVVRRIREEGDGLLED